MGPVLRRAAPAAGSAAVPGPCARSGADTRAVVEQHVAVGPVRLLQGVAHELFGPGTAAADARTAVQQAGAALRDPCRR